MIDILAIYRLLETELCLEIYSKRKSNHIIHTIYTTIREQTYELGLIIEDTRMNDPDGISVHIPLAYGNVFEEAADVYESILKADYRLHRIVDMVEVLNKHNTEEYISIKSYGIYPALVVKVNKTEDVWKIRPGNGLELNGFWVSDAEFFNKLFRVGEDPIEIVIATLFNTILARNLYSFERTPNEVTFRPAGEEPTENYITIRLSDQKKVYNISYHKDGEVSSLEYADMDVIKEIMGLLYPKASNQ